MTEFTRRGILGAFVVAPVASIIRVARPSVVEPPDEIESVQVLSPIQAEFRYGLQGEYGALVIETRRGRRGGG